MTFPGFELLGRVAEGSTGVVWHARQVELDRQVAIKELSPALRKTPGFLERFRAEAQTLALLDDPHVVRVYDYVEEPERAYLVQEWVDGAPLSGVLAQHGRLTPEQGLGVLRGGLIGLAHAHQRGLVHRDVSPANILLDRAGTSKLVDFGLAAPTDQGITPGAATSVGTPAFASPEAVTGAPMTTRSDVYSAAAVLFLLLSGRLPYPGDVAHVLQAHTSAAVPRMDGHGPHLADLLSRAMAKNPAERPADAAAFLAELEQAATERYGAGWLNRSSVAGLVTTAAAAGGTAALTATSTGATAAAPTAPATAQTIAYGAAASTPTTTIPATAQLASTGIRTGARILGVPIAAAIAIVLILIAAIAATVVVVTTSNDQPPTAAEAEGVTEAGSEAASAAPPVPAFHGSYAVTITYTATQGSAPDQVGYIEQLTWQVTSTCPAGPCDVTINKGYGLPFAYAYAGGVWTPEPPTIELSCSIGGTITVTRTGSLQPIDAYDPDSGSPILALSGSGSDTYTTGCLGEGAGHLEYTVEMTRIGD